VIDPQLEYAASLGGSTFPNTGTGIAAIGRKYLYRRLYRTPPTSIGHPVEPRRLRPAPIADLGRVCAKLSPDGRTLLYSTLPIGYWADLRSRPLDARSSRRRRERKRVCDRHYDRPPLSSNRVVTPGPVEAMMPLSSSSIPTAISWLSHFSAAVGMMRNLYCSRPRRRPLRCRNNGIGQFSHLDGRLPHHWFGFPGDVSDEARSRYL